MKSTGAPSSNELEWLHQDSSPITDHQANITIPLWTL